MALPGSLRLPLSRDGHVSLQEYMAFMISRETENVKSSEEIESAFRALSSEGKPYVTKEELYQVWGSASLPWRWRFPLRGKPKVAPGPEPSKFTDLPVERSVGRRRFIPLYCCPHSPAQPSPSHPRTCCGL